MGRKNELFLNQRLLKMPKQQPLVEDVTSAVLQAYTSWLMRMFHQSVIVLTGGISL